LNSSPYKLKKIENRVAFNQNDVCIILATFETLFGEVSFTLSYWLYDDGPIFRAAFLFHDGTDGERFTAIHPAGRVWIERAAASSIDRADLIEFLKKEV